MFVIGSFLRKDHPLFALRIRQAARRGGRVMSLHAVHDDWAMPVAHKITAAPSAWAQALARRGRAQWPQAKGVAAPVAGQADDAARAVAAQLMSGERKAILLGNAATQHPQAGALLALAHWIGEQMRRSCRRARRSGQQRRRAMGACAAGAVGPACRADAVSTR